MVLPCHIFYLYTCSYFRFSFMILFRKFCYALELAIGHLTVQLASYQTASTLTRWLTWSAQYYVEVHAIDANVGVIFDAQINVFLNAEAKISCCTEVAFSQLVLSDLCNIKQNAMILQQSNVEPSDTRHWCVQCFSLQWWSQCHNNWCTVFIPPPKF